jgi:hypothetical protein
MNGQMVRREAISALVLVASLCASAAAAGGAEYYVAPDGKPNAAGTEAAPWDIVSALEGRHAVKGGDTVWIRGGKYRSRQAYDRKGAGFEVKLAGTKDRPIHVRARKGERVTIDGGLTVSAASSYVWLWDLEITVAPDKDISRETKTSGSHPSDLAAPMGGLQIYAGQGCKFINLYIHDNLGGGVGWWKGSTDSEIHGCLIVNNGWKGPDRCHGHCIYTQNAEGTKTIAHCILTTRWGRGQYTMHAYGSSRAYVDNFVIEGNIAYGKGPFLVGGGRPSRNIVVRRNYLNRVPMRIGYNAPHNEDCDIRDNVVVAGGITINRYRKAAVRDNLIVGGRLSLEKCGQVERKGNRLVTGPVPPEARVVLLPNKYDPARAHLAVLNAAGARRVAVKVAPFLRPGEAFRLMDPEDFFGKPLLTDTCKGETISVPMAGPFGAFVLLKTPA